MKSVAKWLVTVATLAGSIVNLGVVPSHTAQVYIELAILLANSAGVFLARNVPMPNAPGTGVAVAQPPVNPEVNLEK